MNLNYQSHERIEDLAENECTIHRAANASGVGWWNLWFYVRRETDGVLDHFAVPINPGGSFSEGDQAVRTWGFTMTSPGVWQVSPSINVLNTGEYVHGPHELPSLWHKTPTVIGVGAQEAWMP